MLSNLYFVIIIFILWLIIAEIIYIWICKSKTKKRVKEDWVWLKMFCFFISAIIIWGIFALYHFLETYLIETIIFIIGIILFIILFRLNKNIGLWVATKNKSKR